MRVLAVISEIWPPAVYMTGISIIYKLQKCLRRMGVKVHILTSIEKWADPSWKEWLKDEEEREGIHFHCTDLKFLKKIPKLNFLMTGVLYTPAVLNLNAKYHFDVIHEYSSLPILLRRATVYKRFFPKLRVVHTLCSYSEGLLGSFKFARNVTSLDKVICTTRHMQEILLQDGFPESKVSFLPTGVDINRFNTNLDSARLREELNIPRCEIMVYIGPLLERKGVFTFVRAAKLVLKEYPESIFVIATRGYSGNFYDHVKNRDKVFELIKNDKEHFRYLEGLQNIPELMSIADIFVFPLITIHGTLGYPSTLLEALAAGKAIAASNITGINELISNGKEGLLFEKGNVDALAKVTGILLSEKGLRDKLGGTAQKKVKDYDINVIAKKLKKIYEEIL